MPYRESKDVDDAAIALGCNEIAKLSRSDALLFHRNFSTNCQRYDGTDGFYWDCFREPYAFVDDEQGWRRVEELVRPCLASTDDNLFLFFNFDDDRTVYRMPFRCVVQILAKTDLMEFYITDAEFTFVFCCTHHDAIGLQGKAALLALERGLATAPESEETVRFRLEAKEATERAQRHREFFVRQSHCHHVVIEKHDSETGARAGGRPPAVLDAAPRCPRTGLPMLYLLTLELDYFGERALSLFCSPDNEARRAAQRLVEPPVIVALCHPRSVRAPADRIESPSAYAGRAITIQYHSFEDVDRDDPSQPYARSKIGGNPCISGEHAQLDALRAMNYVLLAQWLELDYPSDPGLPGQRKKPDVPKLLFEGGPLFVFARCDKDGKVDLETIRCLWETRHQQSPWE